MFFNPRVHLPYLLTCEYINEKNVWIFFFVMEIIVQGLKVLKVKK